MAWFADKLRSRRYSMNLQLLQARFASSDKLYHATAIVRAAELLTRVTFDDFATGVRIQRIAFGVLDSSADESRALYNAVEDVLSAGITQRKNSSKQMIKHLGADAAKEFDRHVQAHEDGLRLILVALSRKADDAMKIKARALRESLYGAKDAIPDAIAILQHEDQATESFGAGKDERDYESIETHANSIALASITW
jgi:hypothetical protein